MRILLANVVERPPFWLAVSHYSYVPSRPAHKTLHNHLTRSLRGCRTYVRRNQFRFGAQAHVQGLLFPNGPTLQLLALRGDSQYLSWRASIRRHLQGLQTSYEGTVL